MRKNLLLLGVGLLISVLAIGAVACGGDSDEEIPDGATEDTVVDPDTVIVFAGVLADVDGNTLYVFDGDEAGVSFCLEDCAQTFRPLTSSGDPVAGEGVGTLAKIERDDGIKQITHNDQPLYYYSNDTGAGDQAGEGINGVWHMVLVGE